MKGIEMMEKHPIEIKLAASSMEAQIHEYDRLYKEQGDFYGRAAQWSGLSDAAYWVLYHMCEVKENVTQSDLCKEWYFSKQTINSAVNKLTELGYIILKGTAGKGNRKMISLTETGDKFCGKYVIPVIEAERKSFKVLTEEERETLLRLMKKQLDTLNKTMEELWQ